MSNATAGGIEVEMSEAQKRTCGQCDHWLRNATGKGPCGHCSAPVPFWAITDDGNGPGWFVIETEPAAANCDSFSEASQ
jgi:hypothetical protein